MADGDKGATKTQPKPSKRDAPRREEEAVDETAADGKQVVRFG